MENAQIAKADGIEICYETFGEKGNSAVLLIMGALAQGILWPTEFCERLANEGFYVIRYDHRDTGQSTCFDFEINSYNLLDMANDGMILLDCLAIKNVNLVGISMGGVIAELISIHYPKRVNTLTLISTSPDFRPSALVYDKTYTEDIKLSRPKQIYIDYNRAFIESPPKTKQEMLEERVSRWRILNGSVVPFEEELYRSIFKEFLFRMQRPEISLNHLFAIKNSFELVRFAPNKVIVPTVIIHGSEDPIFPPDHGKALSEEIAGSKYVFVPGMGHVLNSQFYDLVIGEITSCLKR
jgi:pimeloyl-ACP methyl ester carboxylesterase